MSGITVGLICMALMLFLMFSGMNMGFTFLISGFVGVTMLLGIDGAFSFLGTLPVTTAMTYTFVVLPLFMLMGDISVRGSLTTDAYRCARVWLGNQRGGLAITSTVASAIFGAICGSASATAMIMSQVSWPEMKRYGYDPKIGLSSIAAAGPLAILIPPSTPIIIYGILAEVSVGQLFMAGWIPGIILTTALCLTTLILTRIHPTWAPSADKEPLKEKVKALGQAWPILLLVVMVMVCIWGGFSTVNEAAGVAVVGAAVICFAKRRISVKEFIKTLHDSASTCAGMFFMFIGIQVFNSFLTLSGLPSVISAWVCGLQMSPYAVIWAIVVLYLILGCFIDTPVIMMLTIPLFAPAVAALGFNLIWFGIVSTMCVALGSITPPVGLCLFVIAARIKDVPLATIIRGIWPYILATLIVTAAVIHIPVLATWLPSVMS